MPHDEEARVYFRDSSDNTVFHANRECRQVNLDTFEIATVAEAEADGRRPADCCIEHYHFENPEVLDP